MMLEKEIYNNITVIGYKFHVIEKKILIIGGSGSGKTKSLFNLIDWQPDFDKFCLYAKDPYEAKCKFLINRRESTDLTDFHDFKAFTEYLNDMADIYENIEEYNPNKNVKY